MPTYDYVCDACTHAFEHFQSMSSNRLRTCPQCKKRKLRRLIGSGAGVIFKGGGFYETDYKRKKQNGGRKSDSERSESSESSDKSESTASTSSDSKSTDKGGKSGSGDKKDGGTSASDSSDKSPKKTPSKD